MIQQKILAPLQHDLRQLELLERELEVALATGNTETIQQIIDRRDALMAEAKLRSLRPGEF